MPYAYALAGTNLLSFLTANPAAATTTAITGVDANETLVGIDFRPQNGLLYGLGVNAASDTATLYLISQRTGVATPVGPVGQIALVTAGGTPIDFPGSRDRGLGLRLQPGY